MKRVLCGNTVQRPNALFWKTKRDKEKIRQEDFIMIVGVIGAGTMGSGIAQALPRRKVLRFASAT